MYVYIRSFISYRAKKAIHKLSLTNDPNGNSFSVRVCFVQYLFPEVTPIGIGPSNKCF